MRNCPVSPALAEMLASAEPVDTSGLLDRLQANVPYVTLLGNVQGRGGTAYWWEKLKRQVNANPKLRIHDLRHTQAVALYEKTKDIRAVQEFLGHTSLRSTAYYLQHADPERLRPLLRELWLKPISGKLQ